MRMVREIYSGMKGSDLSEVSQRTGNCRFYFALTVCLAASVVLGIVIGRYYWLADESCPDRLITLKHGPGNSVDDLWAYATFWSYSPQHQDNESSRPIAKFAPKRLLADLEKTFKPLSLKPFEDLPDHCRDKLPTVIVEQPVKPKYPMTELYETGNSMVRGFPLDLDPLSFPLFAADLSSEFQFRDAITDRARYVMDKAEQLMNKRKKPFDTKISIYLSSITPEIEQFLAPQGEIDLAAVQRKAIEEAMNDYRNSTNPLFIVMGDQDLAPGIGNDDVVRIGNLSDPVALAVISAGDAAIFNHGLWPAFGALLSRSNVTSHAMNRPIIDAAKNASLNWKASVTY